MTNTLKIYNEQPYLGRVHEQYVILHYVSRIALYRAENISKAENISNSCLSSWRTNFMVKQHVKRTTRNSLACPNRYGPCYYTRGWSAWRTYSFSWFIFQNNNSIWCCQTHWMGHGQRLNLKMDMMMIMIMNAMHIIVWLPYTEVNFYNTTDKDKIIPTVYINNSTIKGWKFSISLTPVKIALQQLSCDNWYCITQMICPIKILSNGGQHWYTK